MSTYGESAKGIQCDTQSLEPVVQMPPKTEMDGEPVVRLTDGNRLGGSDGPAVRMGAQMPEGYQWAGNAFECVPVSMIEIMNRRNAGEIVDGNGKIDHNKEGAPEGKNDGGEAWKNDARAEGAGKTDNQLTRAQNRNTNILNNIVENNLKDTDFSGTLADLKGQPISNGIGGYFDHLTEMKQSYTGLKRIKSGLEGSLRNPSLTPETRVFLESKLNITNHYLNKIEDLFRAYGGIK